MSERTAPTRQLIIIDTHVNNWESLANDVGNDNLVLILDSHSDGLTQISDYLTALSANAGAEDFVPLQSIYIISHGSVGSLLLGSSTLTGDNLSLYSSQLASIGNSLTETGDIIVYGCNIAQGDVGQQFIQQLAQLTGADVAASEDMTGNAALGGDWLLESAVGPIETTAQSLAYPDLLGLITAEDIFHNYGQNADDPSYGQYHGYYKFFFDLSAASYVHTGFAPGMLVSTQSAADEPSFMKMEADATYVTADGQHHTAAGETPSIKIEGYDSLLSAGLRLLSATDLLSADSSFLLSETAIGSGTTTAKTLPSL